MRKIFTVVLLCCVLFAAGYTSIKNKTKYNYTVVISQSNGIIMDVWKLKNTFVKNAKSFNGWSFKTENGLILVSGNIKVIKTNNKEIWEDYQEYHIEYDILPYLEKIQEEQ